MQAPEHSAHHSSACGIHSICLRVDVFDTVDISLSMGRRVPGAIRHCRPQLCLSGTRILPGHANMRADQ